MKIVGIRQDDVIEILPLEIERITPDGPINSINCSISVNAGCFSGEGQFWAGSNWKRFCTELRELNQRLEGRAKLDWSLGDDTRVKLEFFNLDSAGHIFVRVKIVSDDRYTDKNDTLSIVQAGFEIDPNSLSQIARSLEEIWN